MSFAESANPATIQLADGHYLVAELQDSEGNWHQSSIDLDRFIGNIDGKLTWGEVDFSQSTKNVWLDTTFAPSLILLKGEGRCEGDESYAEEDALNLNEFIQNIEGKLEYSGEMRSEIDTSLTYGIDAARVQGHVFWESDKNLWVKTGSQNHPKCLKKTSLILSQMKALPSAEGLQPATTCTREPQHACLYPMNDTYIITIRGTEFSLHKSQIEFDGPNYFTFYFLANSKQRRIELHRDPGLFHIIVSYLSGYNIFPLDERSIPPTMTSETVLQNLRADAVFYQLRGLVCACDEFVEQQLWSSVCLLRPSSGGTDLDSRAFFPDELQTNTEPASSWRLHANKDILSKTPFDDMITVESMLDEGIDGLQAIAKVEGFATHTLGEFDPRRWKLVGWHIDESRFGGDDENFDWDLHDIDYRLLIVLEDLKAE
ncbi:CVNH domain-containing protein [Rhizoctonia solani AG-1 IA]|uniref:CVNH domain-containing protein n=1 Tax=Thanatephorus cucumeris (strain AG1-IA) TaxID=983506 RepID=L8WNA0_THACA|nr:CVNH domain-containing protein [Rhizoctonia solani AG-1 IA]